MINFKAYYSGVGCRQENLGRLMKNLEIRSIGPDTVSIEVYDEENGIFKDGLTAHEFKILVPKLHSTAFVTFYFNVDGGEIYFACEKGETITLDSVYVYFDKVNNAYGITNLPVSKFIADTINSL